MWGVQCVCRREGYSQVRFEERVEAIMRYFERCGCGSRGFFGEEGEVVQWRIRVMNMAARRGRMAKEMRRWMRREVSILMNYVLENRGWKW